METGEFVDKNWDRAAVVETALSRLTEPHREKKRATILALVDARLSGNPEESVWGRDDTCSRKVYHEKWKKDETFADVLGVVTEAAQGWKDGAVGRALSEAAERLALASPLAVGKLIEKLKSTDEGIVVKSAVAILDRAGLETAVKGATAVTIKTGEVLSDEEQRAVEDALRKAAGGKGDKEKG